MRYITNLSWLFDFERQQPFGRQSINHLVKAIRRRAGFGHVHPRMPQHLCGFDLANKGYGLCVIQNFLGHRDARYTSQCS